MSYNKRKPDRFNDLKKPSFIIMLVITIIVAIPGVFFFFKSRQIQRPTYIIEDEITKIYDSQRMSPKLTLLDKNKKAIEGDVYHVIIQFWNSGNVSIEPKDIWKPIEFIIDPCERIIDYSIIKTSDPETTDFVLLPGSSPNALLLSWNHLAKNYGVKFQVFFVGNDNSKFWFRGNIQGRSDFVNGKSLLKRIKFGRLFIPITLIVTGIVYFAAGFLIYEGKLLGKVENLARKIVRFIFFLLIVASLTNLVLQSISFKPPF